MSTETHRPMTGRKVALIFCSAFAVIIAANLTLAFNAVATFPGLEVKNSYVASQAFDADRAAQEALGWDVSATVEGDVLSVSVLKGDTPVQPKITSAVFGRATSVAEDQFPAFRFDGERHVAKVDASSSGNWNLRLIAEASDGTVFKQRIVVKVVR